MDAPTRRSKLALLLSRSSSTRSLRSTQHSEQDSVMLLGDFDDGSTVTMEESFLSFASKDGCLSSSYDGGSEVGSTGLTRQSSFRLFTRSNGRPNYIEFADEHSEFDNEEAISNHEHEEPSIKTVATMAERHVVKTDEEEGTSGARHIIEMKQGLDCSSHSKAKRHPNRRRNLRRVRSCHLAKAQNL